MKLNHNPSGGSAYTLSGTCPHCGDRLVFVPVAGFAEQNPATGDQLLCHAMRCQGCQRFILGLAGIQRGASAPSYLEHYPLGKPDDSVPKEVGDADPGIASDFAEALRCLWVRSYKASVAMCRRSVEATCKHFGATGHNLERKIDNLAERGKITESLRQMAHAVRLSGNRQLHGNATPKSGDTSPASDDTETVDDLDTCGEEEAKAMIEFTKELFHHVYVMPAKLKIYEKKEPPGETAAIVEPKD